MLNDSAACLKSLNSGTPLCVSQPGKHQRVPACAQVDELYKICGVMGCPNRHTWPEGVQLATAMGFTFPAFPAIPLGQLLPSASPEALDLMASLCQWDPAKRPTAFEAMRHPYFQVRSRGRSGRWCWTKERGCATTEILCVQRFARC